MGEPGRRAILAQYGPGRTRQNKAAAMAPHERAGPAAVGSGLRHADCQAAVQAGDPHNLEKARAR